MKMTEGPGNARDVQTAGYPCILINIALIIVINEIVPEGLAENKPGKCREQNGDANAKQPAIRFNDSY